jgi:LuxR family maltose regulon positive regulatory protein
MPKRRGGETEDEGFSPARVRSARAGESMHRDDLPEKSGLRLVRPTLPAVGLLESKLAPPAGPTHSIPRKALLARLRGSRKVPVVAVVAPSGFGKTTLVAQWAARDRRAIAWLTIEERDNDPLVLFRYLGAALGPVCSVDPTLIKGLSPADQSSPAIVVAWLASAIGRAYSPTVLVVDDAHLLTNPASMDAILMLEENLGRGSQLVIMGRPELRLPTASLRAQGRLAEIDAGDLAMSVDEAEALFERMHLPVEKNDVEELTRRTEGWPAALYLAGLTLQDARFADRPAVADMPRAHSVVDYLRSEFLAPLPRNVVTFLTRTSVLTRMSGPMCDDVLERRGSSQILDDLSGRNMLIVHLDQHGEWYRYHNLLRQLLRADLERREPKRSRQLLERAALWCEEHSLYNEALEYAAELGDPNLMARFLESHTLRTHRHGGDSMLLHWYTWFEANDLMMRFPRLAALGAWLHLGLGQPSAVRRWVAAAEEGMRNLAPEERNRIDGILTLLRSAQCAGGPEQMKSDAERAMHLLPSPEWRPVAMLAQAMAMRMLGGRQEVDPLLIATFEEAMDVEAFPTAMIALTERAVLAIEQDEWGPAEQLVARALEIVDRAGLENYMATVPLYAVAARVAIQAGDMTTAKAHLAQTQRLRNDVTRAIPFLAVRARLELALAYTELTDAAGARTMLREIETLFTLRPNLGVFREQTEAVRERLGSMTTTFVGGSSLTSAELRLLPMLATQYSFREIAERLFVSRHTVKTQAISIYRKLRVTSRTAAVEAAREAGVLVS